MATDNDQVDLARFGAFSNLLGSPTLDVVKPNRM
jgi:hypothetical protein